MPERAYRFKLYNIAPRRPTGKSGIGLARFRAALHWNAGSRMRNPPPRCVTHHTLTHIRTHVQTHSPAVDAHTEIVLASKCGLPDHCQNYCYHTARVSCKKSQKSPQHTSMCSFHTCSQMLLEKMLMLVLYIWLHSHVFISYIWNRVYSPLVRYAPFVCICKINSFSKVWMFQCIIKYISSCNTKCRTH